MRWKLISPIFVWMVLLLFPGLCFADDWPSDPPSTAVVKNLTDTYHETTFTLYVWRSDGHVWVKYQPVESSTIVKASRYVVMLPDDQLTYDLRFIDRYGEAFTNDTLYTGKIFKLCRFDWDEVEYLDYLDLIYIETPFTLIYEQGEDTEFLDIPGESYFTDDVEIMGAPKLTVTQKNNGCTLSWTTSPGAIGYELVIGDLPDVEDIVTYDMQNKTSTTWTYYTGSKQYVVAIMPYNSTNVGKLSNIDIISIE